MSLPVVDLDALIAAADPVEVQRHRAPSMSVVDAEQTLARLMADDVVFEPVAPVAPAPAIDDAIAVDARPDTASVTTARPTDGPTGPGATASIADIVRSVADGIGASNPFAIASGPGEPVSEPPAEHAPVRPVSIPPRELHESEDRPPTGAMALLSPPTVPPQYDDLEPEPPREADPPKGNRGAMGGLFDGDDDSGQGLMLFGEAFDGFGPQPGTDPDMAPVPDESQRSGVLEPLDDDELRLAGADDGWTEREGFGFSEGDAAPTVVNRTVLRPDPPIERGREATDAPPDAAGSLSEKVVISSVRKLFRR